jgi:hypothetical protein
MDKDIPMKKRMERVEEVLKGVSRSFLFLDRRIR